MERFRNATERMSTIYYQKLPWRNTSTSDLADVEKPPVTTDSGGFDVTSSDEASVSRLEADQHVFAWQELSLELGDGKRLLHEVSGKNIREQ